MTTTVDELIEKGAHRLEETSARIGSENGLKARLREELTDDAQFLRKLKPSSIAARAHGEKPREDRRPAPTPTPAQRPARAKQGGRGPNPIVVIAAAFAVGYLLAKAIDWRGHAHPRLA
jgi:hypothetical protein